MARPIKKGLSYFPLDVHAFEDPKLESLSYHYGPFGECVYIRLLQLVYANGYYLKLTAKQLAAKLHKQIGPHWIKVDKILDIIHACVEFGLLERAFFLQGVITSVSIQKQFILSTKRRKNVDIDKYWLLDSATMEHLGVLLSMDKKEVNVNNNLVNVDNNSINVSNNTQSKKKSKRDKNKIKKDKSIYGSPKMHYLTKLIVDRKYINEVDEKIIKYNGLFDSAIESYGFENVLSGVSYLIKHSKRTEVQINDKYSFMKTSLLSNLEHFRRKEEQGDESFEEWFERVFSRMDNKS
jgi:hypothetical protein